MKRKFQTPGPSRRRGTLLPAIVIAVLVSGLCAALVLDRLWIDMARVELRTAAEAAAFAAAGRLASDDRLRVGQGSASLIDAAREAAVQIAAQNRVAGRPVRLDAAPDGDVRFGVVADNPLTGQSVFLETSYDPSTVLVTASALRNRNHGVVLFFQRLTGVATANVIGRAGVTLDNAVVAVRALPRVNVPALPLGILETDVLHERNDTWQHQIEERHGTDRYGFDPILHRVIDGADGIPEITLYCASHANESSDSRSNCCIIDIGNALRQSEVQRQVARGWSQDDLSSTEGLFPAGGFPAPVEGSNDLVSELWRDDSSVVGQQRICVLFREDTSGLIATRFVSGRILVINGRPDGEIEMVFQPCVVTTPTAVIAERPQSVAANPYIYKIHLTH